MAADGALPQDKIRSRLRKLGSDQERIRVDLGQTDEQVAPGAERLLQYLDLATRPHELYEQCPAQGRFNLNDTFFTALYTDDHSIVADAALSEPLEGLYTAADAHSMTLTTERAAPRYSRRSKERPPIQP